MQQSVQRVFFQLSILMCLFFFACSDKGVELEAPLPSSAPNVEVSFSKNVLSVFQTYGCTGCHGGTNGLQLNTVQGILTGGFHGPAVIPFKADSSIVIRKILPNPPFGDRMPQGGSFVTDQDVKVLKDWINLGAKDN
ncbi:MAG: hypothetical protein HYY49_14455 [Ignavibacteriales bacterium]|nr:hypothetical protein [Ignavibacteriales bacterium]